MRVPPSATFISCWPPQMPREGTDLLVRGAGDGKLEGGAPVLGGDGLVP